MQEHYLCVGDKVCLIQEDPKGKFKYVIERIEGNELILHHPLVGELIAYVDEVAECPF